MCHRDFEYQRKTVKSAGDCGLIGDTLHSVFFFFCGTLGGLVAIETYLSAQLTRICGRGRSSAGELGGSNMPSNGGSGWS